MDTIRINDLAIEQAILAHENETPMDADDAVWINSAKLRTQSGRRQFKHDFTRNMRNIGESNPFYKEVA